MVESDHRRPQVLMLISGLHTQMLIYLPTHILIHMQRCVHAYLPHPVYTYRDKNKTKQETFPIVIHMSSRKKKQENGISTTGLRGKASPLEVLQFWGKSFPNGGVTAETKKIPAVGSQGITQNHTQQQTSQKSFIGRYTGGSLPLLERSRRGWSRRKAYTGFPEGRASQGSRVEYVRFPAKSRDLWEFKLRDW